MIEAHVFPEEMQEVVSFHGHFCPGLAIGYRAAKAAMTRIAPKRAEDEELVAIVENRSCSVDAVQVITGCTLGKGNLFLCDYGKQVFTLVSRSSGEGVRVALRAGLARPKLEDGSTDRKRWTDDLLRLADDEIFAIEARAIEIPPKATIHNSLVCERCGEQMMETLASKVDGETCCIPCAEGSAGR